MDNIAYINKEDIIKVDVYGKSKRAKIYKKEFPAKKLLWKTIRKACTRYVMNLDDNYRDSYSTLEECKQNASYFYFRGNRVYCNETDQVLFDKSDNSFYIKNCVVVKLKNGEEYEKFFDTENELHNYISQLGLKDNFFALDYTNHNGYS